MYVCMDIPIHTYTYTYPYPYPYPYSHLSPHTHTHVYTGAAELAGSRSTRECAPLGGRADRADGGGRPGEGS